MTLVVLEACLGQGQQKAEGPPEVLEGRSVGVCRSEDVLLLILPDLLCELRLSCEPRRCCDVPAGRASAACFDALGVVDDCMYSSGEPEDTLTSLP